MHTHNTNATRIVPITLHGSELIFFILFHKCFIIFPALIFIAACSDNRAPGLKLSGFYVDCVVW